MRKSLLEVTPVIPGNLAGLTELAGNLFFSWHRPTRALFEDLDPELWKQTNGNPRLMLRCVSQGILERCAADETYLARYRQALETLGAYMRAGAATEQPLVAYFCAEYGFHESVPIYSGGLGVLAGDYCKAASDERANFVAVGLLYEQGYFTQTVDNDGVQHAEYRERDPRDLPVEPVRSSSGEWVTVSLRIAAREVVARLWKAQVGRVAVYLLDTNCAENAAGDRDITHRLYGGDESTRVRQEIVLGIGGVRALRALGVQPAVWHLNEGHAAFLILELLREHLLVHGLSFNEALEAVAAACVFTTHTPVAAGHDAFSPHLILEHLGDYIGELGIPVERFLELARAPTAAGLFNMTRLALNGTRHVNGVSRIHGAVSAKLCTDQWPEVRPADNPVGWVTNGVHVPTFLHQRWMEFFDRELGSEWRERLRDPEFWRALEQVPDERYWACSQDVKARMLASVRDRLQREYRRKGLSPAQLRHVTRFLDPQRPDVLTIGFARRFATYKRATLLVRDRARLARLLNNPERPAVLLFAGKAHPADEPGKYVLREIRQLMLSEEFAGRIVFLEDYDLQLARSLVSGVDVWLNNPIAPLEASGTSGIKAAINGRLNLSILDGWWAEGWMQDNGWGIPPADVQDPQRRDSIEAQLFLAALEEEVLPQYYTRDEADVPRTWVRSSKRAMMTVIPRFNMRRVLYDYTQGLYQPAAAQYRRLAASSYTGARTLAQWKQRVREAWAGVSLQLLTDYARDIPRGERLRLRVAAALNGLSPADVRVEFAAHRLLPEADLAPPPLSSYGQGPRAGVWHAPLAATGEQEAEATVFALDVEPPDCGQFSTEVRIYPWHELLSHPYELGLMKWL